MPTMTPPPAPVQRASEDDLTRAAMEDPAASTLHIAHPEPTFWRFVTILVFAVVALAVVFWWFR